MIYRPKTGSMLDPSINWHDGRYCVFMTYNKYGPINRPPGSWYCFLASLQDGVHWRDKGTVKV